MKDSAGETPRILVDVDGVLNLSKPHVKCNVGYCRCHPGWVRAFGYSNGQKFRLGLTPRHGSLLRGLAADTGAILTWYTTWNEDANLYVARKAALPQLPVVPVPRVPPPLAEIFHERGEGWGAWKAQKLAPQAAWPFVWFEDEPDARAEAIRHIRVPHKVITVDPGTGLTAEHIAEARGWLQNFRKDEEDAR